MNNLCASGYRLAQTIATLEQWGINEPIFILTSTQQQTPQTSQTQQTQSQQQSSQSLPSQHPSNLATTPVATQFINAWDDLAR